MDPFQKGERVATLKKVSISLRNTVSEHNYLPLREITVQINALLHLVHYFTEVKQILHEIKEKIHKKTQKEIKKSCFLTFKQ